MARPKTGKVRTTLFIEPEAVEALDHIARSEALRQQQNITRTDIINQAIQEYKQKWEKKNGPVPVK